MYDVAVTGDHGQQEKTYKHSETGESTDEGTNIFLGKNFTRITIPPKVARAPRENTILRFPGCVIEDKNANTPMMLFHFVFLMVF